MRVLCFVGALFSVTAFACAKSGVKELDEPSGTNDGPTARGDAGVDASRRPASDSGSDRSGDAAGWIDGQGTDRPATPSGSADAGSSTPASSQDAALGVGPIASDPNDAAVAPLDAQVTEPPVTVRPEPSPEDSGVAVVEMDSGLPPVVVPPVVVPPVVEPPVVDAGPPAEPEPVVDAAVPVEPDPPPACVPDRSTYLNHGSEGFFACAAASDKTAQCWGEGFFSRTPKALVYKTGTAVTAAVQFAAVNFSGCVLLDSGAVHCWTNNDQGQARTEPVIASDVVQISGGFEQACALVRPALAPASVLCWDPEQWTAPAPLALAPGDDPVALASGFRNGCVVLADGRIKCWGPNNSLQLGSGPGPDTLVPKETGSLGAKALDVTVGHDHVCALLEGGAVKCWGQYNDGKLGINLNANLPFPGGAAIESGAVAIAAGTWHTCAAMGDGTVRCWGKGPIGHGFTPTAVAGLSDVVAVGGGRDYACALVGTGTLRCWGGGTAGSLGHAQPTAVPAASGGPFTASVPAECP